ncbi:MAG: phosphoglucosamine mutase [Saccharospirillaceae bacterium]|jgi:phosphoglucosamine mutase|nr:phosphoglucosamine mutase [Thalassolituus sp. HI0120]MCH2041549.1 phosphoglucosamine mutase [Saccharospirillaceae bacterium]
MSRKYFGTDGIRGEVGEFPITPEFVMKLGWAAGKVFAEQGKKTILIGKDTRISGYMFESALEAGLSAAGVNSGLLGPMPTPGIAYLTRTFYADAGIVISASHNPYQDNGIKFFSSNGTKLDDKIEQAIEEHLDRPMTTVASDQLGKAFRIDDAAGRYIEFCKSSARRLRLKGQRIVLDCAHGATYQIAPAVFRELGAEVVVIGAEPDGLNINKEVGSTSPKALQRKVTEIRADLGIAFDGDGDRVVMVDGNGEVVDGDELLFIMATHAKSRGRLGGGVVGTLMSNLGLELALKEDGIDFARAKVGDRYVMQQLKERNWRFGGESSGHLLCLDSTTTGDGVVSALQVMMAIQDLDKPLHELKKGMSKCPQTMINVRRNQDIDVNSDDTVKAAVAEVENTLAGRGRVLLRPSGTEPVVRVMVEGEDAAQVSALTQELAEVVEKVLA